MAQFTFRLNVNSAQFPFLSKQIGATVIKNPQDTYYVAPNLFSGEVADKNIGIPQLYFCENVMPTGYGFRSVAFTSATQRLDFIVYGYILSELGESISSEDDRLWIRE